MNRQAQEERVRRLPRYLLSIVFLWAIPASVIATGPLELSTHAFDTGTVKEGVTIRKSVILKNTGHKEIVIKNISTS